MAEEMKAPAPLCLLHNTIPPSQSPYPLDKIKYILRKK